MAFERERARRIIVRRRRMGELKERSFSFSGLIGCVIASLSPCKVRD